MKYLVALAVLFVSAPLMAQNTVTLGASVTAGNGQLQTVVTWSTNPAAPGTNPCTATGDPAWAGAKAASGSQTITFTKSATLNLSCSWPGDSIVTFTWTNPTKNTDGSTLSDLATLRLKYTFNATIDPGAAAKTGETAVDLTPPVTVKTITGITQTGTLLGEVFAENALGVFSAPSTVAMKVFTGAVSAMQSVGITVNPVPMAPTGLMAN